MFIGNKKCRIYAACGVSQTPTGNENKEEGTNEKILFVVQKTYYRSNLYRTDPGYHYRTVSGKPFRTGSYRHKSHRKHLHECPEHDDLSTGLLFHYHGYLQYRKCPHNRQDHSRCHDLFPVHHSPCQPGRTDHPAADPSR
ncbi:Uncharacterised protein [Blautia wexlerae]|uniref:Uncharacterized protein n=1 Tax=Blautia wexlerae TaxID=418240 RepID=A0A174U5M7_9FIRM|nr:Uncharacterised protein [Blautia wexlerae]